MYNSLYTKKKPNLKKNRTFPLIYYYLNQEVKIKVLSSIDENQNNLSIS